MNFIEKIAPAAIKYMRQEGILASLTIAQAILESDSGKSELAVKANNLFGMKANSTWTGPVYKKTTREYVNGKWIEGIASFCLFKSIEACMEYRSTVFLKSARYQRLWGITDYKKAAQVIWECGYATAPDYPQKLINVIEKNELYKYDKEISTLVKVFIDPGHGGTDSGATGNGLVEKSLTLAISLKIRSLLGNYENVLVKLSRDDDRTLTLKQRTDMANQWGADYLVSVHINAGGGEGYEDYIFNGNVSTATVANQNVMHEEILKQIGLKDLGKKRSNLHMTRASKMPAILTESGFIDHKGDAAKLKESAFIDKIALGHVNGIVKIFSLTKKTAGVKEEMKVANNQASAFAKVAWEKAQAKKGKDGNSILDGTRPQEPLTREQFAVVLDRLGLIDPK